MMANVSGCSGDFVWELGRPMFCFPEGCRSWLRILWILCVEMTLECCEYAVAYIAYNVKPLHSFLLSQVYMALLRVVARLGVEHAIRAHLTPLITYQGPFGSLSP